MAFRLEPTAAIEDEVRRVGAARLDDAISRLETLEGATPEEIERAVHEVRKRCKEVRALARLVRPVIGDDYSRTNKLLRDAAAELASIRDAHALLSTFDHLRATSWAEENASLDKVRHRQAALATEATHALLAGDPRIREAHELLGRARRRVAGWDLPSDFSVVAQGLAATYKRGARGHRRAQRKPSDERLHEWRKAVKTLWYQLRLIEPAAPSVIGAKVADLDVLAELLGEDHDLAVLVAKIRAEPKAYGGKKAAKLAVALARERQRELRVDAFRLGATMYAEPTDAFVDRMRTYWATALELGPEPRTDQVAGIEITEHPPAKPADAALVERERKYLLVDSPSFVDEGTRLRQGYLAVDGSVSVRVRAAEGKGRTLTIKSGAGAVRTELEWDMSHEEFEAAWDLTKGRRIHKVRHNISHNGHVIEVDVFLDELDGLVMAEVEFESDAALAQFEPPPWFGREVTNELRYTNASLAVDGLDPEDFT